MMVLLVSASGLWAQGGVPEDVQKLIEALQDKDAMVRLRAARSLGEMGAKAQPAMEALQKAMNDEDQDVRAVAARALERITAQSDPELTELIGALKNPDPLTRLQAAKRLGELGGRAAVALPALEQAQNDADEDVRRVVRHAIEKIQSSGSPKVRQLIEQLRDPDAMVRLGAARQLGQMGAEARPALEALKAAREDPDEVVRIVVKNALEKLEKAGEVAVDLGGVAMTDAAKSISVVKVEQIFSPPEVNKAGMAVRAGAMRFIVTVKNTARQAVQIGTMRVHWLMGEEEIHNDDVGGPILPLLPGQTSTHTFSLRWDRESKWDRRTRSVVEIALATPLELDKADRMKLEAVQQELARLRVVNPQPIYSFGILMGDQFTIQNNNDQICKGLLIALQGYDNTNEWVYSLLYYAPLVPKGYTHVANDPAKPVEGDAPRSSWWTTIAPNPICRSAGSRRLFWLSASTRTSCHNRTAVDKADGVTERKP
jgi:3-methyladenine DNA glycosylase AlkC